MDTEPLPQEEQDIEPMNTEDYSPAELQAMEQGWRPQSEWEGDADDWVSAPEFNRRGELMDRIKTQTKTINQLKRKTDDQDAAIREITKNHTKALEAERDKVLKELKAEKVEAIRIGDAEAVVEIDDRIAEVKAAEVREKAEEPQQVKPGQPPQEIIDWTQKTEWYGTDASMTGAADMIAARYVQQNPDALNNPTDILQHIESQIKKDFPHKFRGRTPAGPSDQGGSTTPRAGAGKPKITARRLNDEQRRIAKTMVDAGAIESMDEYAKQLNDIGALDQ